MTGDARGDVSEGEMGCISGRGGVRGLMGRSWMKVDW
jgi:hypothetical protein